MLQKLSCESGSPSRDSCDVRARLLFVIPGTRALGLRAGPLTRRNAPPAVCVGVRVVASIRSVPSPAGREVY